MPVGSFFGLVGPNGAGKTTTLSMVTGLLRPDAGRVIVAGVDVWADPAAAKARMGVLPDGLRLFERLSGPELLSYLGRLRGMPAETVTARATELIAVLDLDEAGNKLVADYSTGMRKKITLAAALLHSPSGAAARRAAGGGRPGVRADHPERAGPGTPRAAAPWCSPRT